LGRHHETVDLIQRLIMKLDCPAIIDADGLNAFKKDKSVLEGEHTKVVLTPHLGEFKRIIGSFLAQGMTPISSAICGVFIHGLSGDIAAAELGSRSVIAGDLIDYLPDAFKMINSFCK